MAESIYRVTEVIGTSTKSWEEASKNAVVTSYNPWAKRVGARTWQSTEV